ncbi:MAG: glutathione S-transferase family protein, partial [Alphaproteobacteria bacterium]|nr:glutathione S-transferase family protein [Alphaproteobacteria bacterium]
MADMTIYLGNKNYSSWSMRPWLALKHTTVAFDEVVIPLFEPGSRETILKFSPSGRVPALHHGDTVVWESLAICEYLAESFPTFNLWPKDPAIRTTARAVSTEMHGGFAALRQQLPMNVRSTFPGRDISLELQADINRVMAIWRDCRTRFGDGKGDFLFGSFTIADAMYAPVVTRFRTYRIEMEREAELYCEAIMALPAMQEWLTAARNEPMIIERYEF